MQPDLSGRLFGRVVGRYAVFSEIAAGGMATVHLGRLLGASGFSRVVALKALHPQLAIDPSFVDAFLDEAKIVSRIRHPNVVPTLDVVASGGELLLVMEYVAGESLSRLIRSASSRDEPIPLPIVSAVIGGLLQGLHSAHEAMNELGNPLGVVHRDVSPQNVLVGADGVARVLDFGIAKAAGRAATTKTPTLKGKIAYMAEEQARSAEVTRRTDVWAAAVVLWEMITRQRLFEAADEIALLTKVLTSPIPPPSSVVSGLPPELDAIACRGLCRDPNARFATALEMANALERAVPSAPAPVVAAWVERLAGAALAARAAEVSRVERIEVDAIEPRTAAGLPVAPSGTLVETVVSPTAPATQSRAQSHAQSRAWLVIVPIAIAIGATVAMTNRSTASRAAAASADSAASTPKESVSIAEASAPASSASPAASAEPPSAAPAPPATPKNGAAIKPGTSAAAKGAAPKKAKCDPPYTVDSLGRHRYLPECL